MGEEFMITLFCLFIDYFPNATVVMPHIESGL